MQVCALLYCGKEAGIVSDDECQPAGIGSHVLLEKFGELIGSPRFPFRVERDDAIRWIQGGEQFRFILHFRDLDRQKVSDPPDVIFAKLRQLRIPGLSDPNHPQLQKLS
jgi:hypothetical protein